MQLNACSPPDRRSAAVGTLDLSRFASVMSSTCADVPRRAQWATHSTAAVPHRARAEFLVADCLCQRRDQRTRASASNSCGVIFPIDLLLPRGLRELAHLCVHMLYTAAPVCSAAARARCNRGSVQRASGALAIPAVRWGSCRRELQSLTRHRWNSTLFSTVWVMTGLTLLRAVSQTPPGGVKSCAADRPPARAAAEHLGR